MDSCATSAERPDTDEVAPKEAPRLRGFAAMSAEDRRRLGAKGGKAAHARGTAHKFTKESASAAGRLPHDSGTAHRWTSDEARDAALKRGRRRRAEGEF